jgi:CRP/FNR family cyclic AMP-dependent transcriptional regulator
MRLFSQDTKVTALKRAPLFEGLSRKELTHLARVSEDMEIEAGATLCKEGEIGHEFFVIVEGEVEIKRGSKKVALRGGGEFVGEIALLEQTPRTATVTAKTPLRVFVLTDKDFRDMLKENPSVERKILRALARRVVELSKGDPTVA